MQKEHECCILCGGKYNELENYSKNNLVKCQNCKFVFCKKIPSKQELINHYQGYGRNDYLSPITIKRYEELLDEFEKFRKTNKIIDVGCGVGYFLEVAKKRGWEVYGTEFTENAVKICAEKGINMHIGGLNIDNYEPESFDIITSFEVIEHINNPNEELNKFHSILRKGGLVYCTTPNFNSLIRYKLKENYDVICYPEHLSYYTPKTLRFAFKKNKFITQKLNATGISVSRFKNSTANMKQIKKVEKPISKQSSDELIRNKMEHNSLLGAIKKIINKCLTITGTGDALKIFAIKGNK